MEQQEQQEILKRLFQIEEQANLTLDELPKHLAKERLRLIISLVKHMRAEVTSAVTPPAAHGAADGAGNTRGPQGA